jgi:hypothetical protein
MGWDCLWTAASNGHIIIIIINPLDDTWEWRATVEVYCQNTEEPEEETCPSATLYITNPAWTDQSSVVRGRRLTTWAM